MTNYDLEETELLKWQAILSLGFIISTIISITLTYNQILKHQYQNPIFTEGEEQNILRFNRLLATSIAIGFLIINIKDKKVKQKYNLCNEQIANLQIDASGLTLVATLIVLYIAFSNPISDLTTENPTL